MTDGTRLTPAAHRQPRCLPAAAAWALLATCVAASAPAGAATCAESAPLPAGIARLSLDQGHRPLLREGNGRTWRLQPIGRQMMLEPRGDAQPAMAVAADILPGSEPALGRHDIRRAWLAGPTHRYAHGALGSDEEAGELRVTTADGRALSLRLGEDSVFEDRHPRLVDLDGDGRDEIVVVHSYLARGSALAVYGLRDGRLTLLDETAPLGSPHRWLNPAGFPDLDGDGRPEIAVVQTPHSGGTLVVYRFADGALHQLGSLAGFSNHAFGSSEQALAAVADLDRDGRQELILPADGRRIVEQVWWADGRLQARRFARHADPVVTTMLAGDFDSNGRPEILYGLADARLVYCTP